MSITNELSRRSALATLAALPALALTDEVPLVKLPPAESHDDQTDDAGSEVAADALADYVAKISPPSDEFTIRYKRDREDSAWEVEGVYVTDHAARTRERAKEPAWFDRQKFQPRDAEARFLVVQLAWELPAPWPATCSSEYSETTDAEFDEWHDAQDLLPMPTSLLDIPPGFSGSDESWTDFEPLTLADGLAEVVRLNGKVIGNGGAELGMPWFGLVELGRGLRVPLINIDLEANGIGRFDVMGYDPIRLYRPTAEQKAAFALNAEGGAL